jgi:hypothetical protein
MTDCKCLSEGPQSPDVVDEPEAAPEFLEHAEFHIYGGSYWGHAGCRGRGWLYWGL